MDFFSWLMGKRSGGGGGAVDKGYYIEWDGNTEGRDVFDTNIGISFCKISETVLTAEQVNGAELLSINGEETCVAAEIEGGVIALGRGEPYAFSGSAGSYSVPFGGNTVKFVCPSNGTYFLFVAGYGHTEYIRKPTTE